MSDSGWSSSIEVTSFNSLFQQLQQLQRGLSDNTLSNHDTDLISGDSQAGARGDMSHVSNASASASQQGLGSIRSAITPIPPQIGVGGSNNTGSRNASCGGNSGKI